MYNHKFIDMQILNASNLVVIIQNKMTKIVEIFTIAKKFKC